MTLSEPRRHAPAASIGVDAVERLGVEQGDGEVVELLPVSREQLQHILVTASMMRRTIIVKSCWVASEVSLAPGSNDP